MRTHPASSVRRHLPDALASDRVASLPDEHSKSPRRRSQHNHIAEPLESRLLLSASLIKNINTTSASAAIRDFAVANGALWFLADDAYQETRLWKTDGTAAGTIPVNGLIPSVPDLVPDDIVALNGLLYFFAHTPSDGYDEGLWKSNGTPAGTSEIGKFYLPEQLTSVNGTLYFCSSWQEDSAYYQLWRSDGSAAGTAQLYSWLPKPAMGVKLANAGGTLLVAADPTLYTIGGSGARLSPLTQIPRPPEMLIGGTTRAFFSQGTSLWTSDGTTIGTKTLHDFSNYFSAAATHNGSLYFDGQDPARGSGLWKSDGTPAGTVLVTSKVNPNGGFAELNGKFFFVGTDAAHGTELWQTDGTAAGTILFSDLDPGPDSGVAPSSALGVFNGKFYFEATNGTRPLELWQSDGTAAGTTPFYQINRSDNGSQIAGNPNQGPAAITIAGTTFFTADDGAHGRELWKTDGTPAGTRMVADINPGAGSSDPSALYPFNGQLYFNARDSADTVKVWKTDGTTAGTVPVIQNAWHEACVTSNASLYFTDWTEQSLSRMQGSSVQTLLQLPPNTWIGELTPVGALVYFYAFNPNTGTVLYRSDGTVAGTAEIMTVDVPRSSPLFEMAAVNGMLYFTVSEDSGGKAVWRTDGSEGGTAAVYHAPMYGSIMELTPAGGKLYFDSYDPNLYESKLIGIDPATENASVVFTQTANPGPVGLSGLYCFGNNLYFVAGYTLYRTDGTSAGTVSLTSISNAAPNFITAGETLYFIATSLPGWTKNLYTTDGTPAGTKLLNPALAIVESHYGEVTVLPVDNRLFFIASDGTHGNQLWQTDFTTTALADPGETAAGWVPDSLLDKSAGGVVFAASDSQHGSELWGLVSTPAPVFGAPSALLDTVQPPQQQGSATIPFTVTYSDPLQIDTTTLGNGNLTVTTPDGNTLSATFVGIASADTHTVQAIYSIPAPFGMLSDLDNGVYAVSTTADPTTAVKNANGVTLPTGQIGTFDVQVPASSSGPNLVTASLAAKLPTSAVAGSAIKGGLSVMIKNTGDQTAQGPIIIYLYACSDTSCWSNAPLVGTATRTINLKSGRSQKISISRMTWPASLNGSYYLIAHVNAARTIGESRFIDNLKSSASPVRVASPFVDLKNLWPGTLPKITSGKKVSFLVPIKNQGNVTARGTITITVQASPTGSLADAIPLGAPPVRINIAPGKTQKLSAKLTVPTLASGTYRIVVTLGTLSNDAGTDDKTVVSSGTFTVP